MHEYRKTTRYHSGAIHVTVDHHLTTLTRMSGNHPTKSVICTHAQSREVAYFILEALSQRKEPDLTAVTITPAPESPPLTHTTSSPSRRSRP